MSEVFISDEAWHAADDASVRALDVADLKAVVRAAAPHIDRAARIDELRRLAERFPSDVLPDPGDESDYYLGLSEAGSYIADRIAELESGD